MMKAGVDGEEWDTNGRCGYRASLDNDDYFFHCLSFLLKTFDEQGAFYYYEHQLHCCMAFQIHILAQLQLNYYKRNFPKPFVTNLLEDETKAAYYFRCSFHFCKMLSARCPL
jgi:hypothetical protein